jgi:hypothetical protein
MLKILRCAAASIAISASAVAFSQATPAPSPSPVPVPDISRILAQSLTDKDVETIFGALRDGMQGRQPDAQKIQALTQKFEGLAAIMLKEMMASGLPMIDQAEAQLKEELRKRRELPQSGAKR